MPGSEYNYRYSSIEADDDDEHEEEKEELENTRDDAVTEARSADHAQAVWKGEELGRIAERFKNNEETLRNNSPRRGRDGQEERLQKEATEYERRESRREDFQIFGDEIAKEPGEVDLDVIYRYVHGPEGLGKNEDEDNTWRTVENYLAREDELTLNERVDLIHKMARQADLAEEATSHSLGGEKPGEERLDRWNNVHASALHYMTEKSPNHPIEEFTHPDPIIDQVWNKVWNDRIEEWRENTNAWDALEIGLEHRKQEIREFQETGEFPNWLKPEKFTPERMQLSPENEALGYNQIHNQPIDFHGDPGETAEYLRGQMDAHLASHGNINGGVNQAEFAKALIHPYLDRELATDFHRFDADDWNYTDDGPGNFKEQVYPLVEGDPTDPMSHAQVSYARLMRNTLMGGMTDEASIRRPDLLAESLPRNAMGLERMAEFCHEVIETSDNQAEYHQDPPWHEPAVRWNSSPEENIAEILSLTGNLKDPTHLRETIDLSENRVRETFATRKLPDDFPREFFSHEYEVDRPKETDWDYPQRTMVREALGDLYEARNMTDRIDLTEQSELTIQATLEGKLKERFEELQQERRGMEFISELSQRVERDPDINRKRIRDEGHSEAVTEAKINIWEEEARWMEEERNSTLENGQSREDWEKQHYPTGEKLAERIVERLAHADFLLQSVYRHGELANS